VLLFQTSSYSFFCFDEQGGIIRQKANMSSTKTRVGIASISRNGAAACDKKAVEHPGIDAVMFNGKRSSACETRDISTVAN